MNRIVTLGFLCGVVIVGMQACIKPAIKPSFALEDIQGGWWSDCTDPAVEFAIEGNQYSGDFFGDHTLTIAGDTLVFTDGLVVWHEAELNQVPISFRILAVNESELVLRPLPGNPKIGDWHLQSCDDHPLHQRRIKQRK